MAIRTRAVYPDTAYVLPDGETIAIVSEDALLDEAVSMLRVAYRLGGIVQVVQDRAKTGVPNEMVTVGALVQWRDRTDAKPQPEPAVAARSVEWGDDPTPDEIAALDEPLGPDELEDPTPEQLEAALEDEAMPATEELEEAVAVGVPVGVEVGEASYEQAMAAVDERFGPQPPRETRTPRETGEGSGALPFQRGSTEPTARPEVDLSQVVRGDASSLPRGDASPAPAGSSEGIDDGLDAASLPDEDDSSIPESRR
jgi:hypothetical protein